jgi:hypothetical protein
MTCPECHGSGHAIRHPLVAGTNLGDTPAGTYPSPPTPCPECNGTGIASCCDTAGSAKGDEPVTLHPLLFPATMPGPRPASVVNRDRPWPTYAPVNP